MLAINSRRPAPLRRLVLAAFAGLALAAASSAQAQKTIEWRYGHMNPPNSAAGMQATRCWRTRSPRTPAARSRSPSIRPRSSASCRSSPRRCRPAHRPVAQHRGGIGSLYEPFGALDTPYLYRDVDHLMKVMDVNSPVMKKLNEGLVKDAGVRVLYAYYFGTRQLTANKAVMQPSDLARPEDPRDPVPDLHDGG